MKTLKRKQATFLRNVLGRKLRVNRIHHPGRFFPIPNEASVDLSGAIYARYGRQLVHPSEIAGVRSRRSSGRTSSARRSTRRVSRCSTAALPSK